MGQGGFYGELGVACLRPGQARCPAIIRVHGTTNSTTSPIPGPHLHVRYLAGEGHRIWEKDGRSDMLDEKITDMGQHGAVVCKSSFPQPAPIIRPSPRFQNNDTVSILSLFLRNSGHR